MQKRKSAVSARPEPRKSDPQTAFASLGEPTAAEWASRGCGTPQRRRASGQSYGALLGSLHLRAFYPAIESSAEAGGRPAFDPPVLIRLWVDYENVPGIFGDLLKSRAHAGDGGHGKRSAASLAKFLADIGLVLSTCDDQENVQGSGIHGLRCAEIKLPCAAARRSTDLRMGGCVGKSSRKPPPEESSGWDERIGGASVEHYWGRKWKRTARYVTASSCEKLTFVGRNVEVHQFGLEAAGFYCAVGHA